MCGRRKPNCSAGFATFQYLPVVFELLFVAPHAQDDVERLRASSRDARRSCRQRGTSPSRWPAPTRRRRNSAAPRRDDRASPHGWRVPPGGGRAAGSRPVRCGGAWSASAPGRSADRAPDAAPTARYGARRSMPPCSPAHRASAASAGPSHGPPSGLSRADGRAWRNSRIPWRFLLVWTPQATPAGIAVAIASLRNHIGAISPSGRHHDCHAIHRKRARRNAPPPRVSGPRGTVAGGRAN